MTTKQQNGSCGSTHIFKLGKGLFSKNVQFHCHRRSGHEGFCRYIFEWKGDGLYDARRGFDEDD